MRRVIMLLLSIVWRIPALASDPGFEQPAFPSRLLDRTVKLGLHVPDPGVVERWRQAHPRHHLRLVLFLPGAYDGPKDLLDSGLHGDLRRAEAAGEAAPSLWVAVTHFKSWYADRRDGAFPFERFLVEELLPAMEKAHPGFGGDPTARTVAGLSMGGFGALNLSARTHAFGRCVALSPALVRPPFAKFGFFVRRALRKVFSDDPVAFAPWNPWEHLGGTSDLIVGCGTEDRHGLAPVTHAFAELCRSRRREVEVHFEAGDHDWAYWRKAFAGLAARIAEPVRGEGPQK